MSDQKPMKEPAPFGVTLLVDKPLEWTSFDVVNKLRYAAKHITGRKKIKVGHAGTLDPLATGLMIVCVGSHTKRIHAMMGLDKTYTGTFQLGATTPSYDLETEIDQTNPVPDKNEEALQECAQSFLGEIDQLPPAYSAKKVDGRKAYDLARAGKDVALKTSRIRIDQFEIDTSSYPEIRFELRCSKGTYVRSLAHDFGQKLGCGAHLTSLQRTAIGSDSLSSALSLEDAAAHLESTYAKYLKSTEV